jgi:hypothetical protein
MRALVLTACLIPAASLFCSAVSPEERREQQDTPGDDPRYYAPNYYIDEDDTHAPASEGDSELGEQVILHPQPTRAPIRGLAETYLFWSDNVGADSSDPNEGWFFAGTLGARWKQRLADHLFLDTYAYQDLYRYDTDGLDFESTEFGLGLIRNLPEFHDIVLYGRYEFLYIHSDDPSYPELSSSRDLTNRYHRIRAGAYKTLFQTAEQAVTLSVEGRFDLDASPSRLERHQYSARVGHYWRLNECLSLSSYAKASFSDYENGGREDWYVYAGLELGYKFTESITGFASLLYGNNDSNRPGGLSDYDVWQAGLGVGIRGSF